MGDVKSIVYFFGINRFKIYFEKLSLTKKLLLTYIVLFLIPLMIFGTLFIRNVRNNIEKDALNSNLQMLQQQKNAIEHNIETCEMTAQSIINNKDIVNYATDNEPKTPLDIVAFNNDLQNIYNIINTNPNINVISFYMEGLGDNELLPVILDENHLKIADSWKKKILELKGKAFWGISTVSGASQTENKDSISLFREIEYPIGKHVGIIQVNMFLKIFFNGVFNDTDTNSFYCVTDNNNNVIFNTENVFGKKIKADKKWIISNLVNKTINKEGSFKVSAQGIDLTVEYIRLEKIDCWLYKVSSISTAVEELQNANYTIILAGILILFLLSIVTYFIISILFKKLRIVIDLMRKFQDGQMFIDVPQLGNDEIGELAMHFKNMLAKINELIFTVVKKQSIAKDAEIRALHTQINAHFMYNILESLKMIALVENNYKISDALTSLGKLMRYNINWENQYVLLNDEIKHIKHYIGLINIRYNNRITFQIEEKYEPAFQCKILKMLLQPIVENAVVHGFEPKGKYGNIKMELSVADDILLIVISDDGIGMSVEELAMLRSKLEGNIYNNRPEHPKENGIGLENVNERIKLYYGSKYGLEVESEENVNTRVTLKLPYKMNNK